MDLRRERKRSLKLREMEEAQEEDRRERENSTKKRRQNTLAQQRKRASDPPAVAAERRMREAQGKAVKRASDPPAVAAERRMTEAQGKAVKRASDPPAVAAERRMTEAQGKAVKRASDPPAVAAERRMTEAQGKAVKRASDPPAVAAERRMTEAQAKAVKRASDPPAVAAERRMTEAQAKAVKRQSELFRQREAETRKRKRELENEEASKEKRQQESAAKKQRRIRQNSRAHSIEEISQLFMSATREGPDYICTCCHRLMYRKTVIEFNISKYPKAPEEFVSMSVRTSAKDKVWICKTCDYALRRGRMPAQSKANKLDLENIPTELSDLSPLEERLICLRIPFMKMVALPCGKQRAIHGPAVNVPTDLTPVCTLLPRLPSQAQMVPMKLKRKLCYKGHYMYQYVRPAKVLAALEWLRANNPLYRDVKINSDWLDDAAQDDADLWEALSAQPPLPVESGTTGQGDANQENDSLPDIHANCPPPLLGNRDPNQENSSLPDTQQIVEDMATLNLLARQRGFVVRDVLLLQIEVFPCAN